MKFSLKLLFIFAVACSLFSCLGPDVALKPKTSAQVPALAYKKILVEALVPHPDYKPMLEDIFRYYLQEAGVTSTSATEILDPSKVGNTTYLQERMQHYKIEAILQIEYQHAAERTLYTPTPKGSWARSWASQDEDRSYILKLIDVQTQQTIWTSEAEVKSIAMLDDNEADILSDYSKALADKTVKALLKSGMIQATGKMFEGL